MIQISKEEKSSIIKKYPDIGIVRTVRQKSKRHRYYMEERRDAMQELRKLRGEYNEPRSSRKKSNKYNQNRNVRRNGNDRSSD